MGGAWGNTYTIVEQSSRSILPAVAYMVNNCKLHFVGKSTFSLIQKSCNAASRTKMSPFAPVIAYCIRHERGFVCAFSANARSLADVCVCVCVVAWWWGGIVKHSMRIGFSNTGSSARAAAKGRQLEMPSLRVCIQCDCWPTCVWLLSWIDPLPIPKFIWRASHDSGTTQIAQPKPKGSF